jgi:hypothetical protein
MIRFLFKEGYKYDFEFICDTCTKPINSAGDGLAVFPERNADVDVQYSEVCHVHKGNCTNDLIIKYGQPKSCGLDVFLCKLTLSLGIQPSDLSPD